MSRLPIALSLLVLLGPSLALAQDDPLAGIGRLLIEGQAGEARPRIIALRDEAIARKDASREASAWLLLGMADVSGSDAGNARANLLQAEAKYTALGDYFGAWFALWTLAEIEGWDGGFDAAIAVHERAQDLLTRAADPSVPFTLDTLKWNIDDTASAGLMEELYRGLTHGKSAAEALRDAQLAVRETHSHPRYWAAFTLHGDPQGRWKSH